MGDVQPDKWSMPLTMVAMPCEAVTHYPLPNVASIDAVGAFAGVCACATNAALQLTPVRLIVPRGGECCPAFGPRNAVATMRENVYRCACGPVGIGDTIACQPGCVPGCVNPAHLTCIVAEPPSVSQPCQKRPRGRPRGYKCADRVRLAFERTGGDVSAVAAEFGMRPCRVREILGIQRPQKIVLCP
ncbi:MAG: hypothetical protein WC732_09580 [Candidatus Omnitrophota bacterium]